MLSPPALCSEDAPEEAREERLKSFIDSCFADFDRNVEHLQQAFDASAKQAVDAMLGHRLSSRLPGVFSTAPAFSESRRAASSKSMNLRRARFVKQVFLEASR